MDQNNSTTKEVIIDEKNYLVTKGVDPKTLPKDMAMSDLDQLTKAENKSTYKANIAKNIRNPQVQRAVSSLRLVNPFKGY